MLKVIKRINRVIGTPLSLKANALIDKRDYLSLVSLETADPRDYPSARDYLLDAQVIALTRKLEGLPTGRDLERAAIDTFYKCEEQCFQTNQRVALYLNWFERGFVGDSVDEALYKVLLTARKHIADVLGQVPQDLVPRLSGGSTFYDKGEEITIPHKMDSRPSVTPAGWSVVADLWRETAWSRAHSLSPLIVLGNRFTTVPKDSKKNRGICVEPSLNVAYQLALGSYIRERLLDVAGIDISGKLGLTAQDYHRSLARLGSITGSLATLDLSNASDTVAYQVVKLLLPKAWFDVLKELRSPSTFIDGNWVKLQKFSSMGNGFTFELETLIFWALARTVSPQGVVSSYGDDIILPTCASGSLRGFLKLLGFEVNAAKSFTDENHPFRESCGGDYFKGEWVRPIYLKVMPDSPASWMVTANLITTMGQLLGLEDTITSAFQVAVSQIPVKLRLYGPKRAGDGVIHSEDRSLWITREKRGWGRSFEFGPSPLVGLGYGELRVLRAKQRRVSLSDFTPPVQLASALLGTPSQGPVPRDGIAGYKAAWQTTVM